MATDDCKNYLVETTGVAAKLWKRRSKQTINGVVVRVFENTETGIAVEVAENNDGTFSATISAVPLDSDIHNFVDWHSSSNKSVEDLVSAIINFETEDDSADFREVEDAGLAKVIGSHFLFHVFNDPDFGIAVAICPLKYWEEEGCMYDNEIDVSVFIPNLFSLSESIYEFGLENHPESIENATEFLKGFGLVQNKKFSEFMNYWIR